MGSKIRIDQLMADRGLAVSRERAKTAVMAGLVYIGEIRIDKPGQTVDENAEITVRGDPVGFVSRGGLKLEKALADFNIDVAGANALDAGASTGGFTDCMLKRGAKHVWAVDVGYGQFAWTLRNDPRVTLMERANIRHMTPETIGQPLDFAAVDLSFISLKLVLPPIHALLTEDCRAVCLIKPQFEAGRELVGKKGVVRDPAVHIQVLRDFCANAEQAGFYVHALGFSPIRGPEGNIEYLSYMRKTQNVNDIIPPKTLVEQAHGSLGERT